MSADDYDVMKLAVLITHPIQYFAPVFRQLASYPGVELRVYFGSDHGRKPVLDTNFKTVFAWDSNPADGFQNSFISRGKLSRLNGVFGLLLGLKATYVINSFRPDAVLVFGYSPAFISIATVFLRLSGRRLMLRAETTDSALDRSLIKDFFRTFILKFYYKQFSFVFPIGVNSSEHYKRMGVSVERQLIAQYSVDVDYFDKQVEKWVPERLKLRKTVGIPPNAHVLIFCGKMFPPKDPLIIPAALATIPSETLSKLWLIAIGNGELRDNFENQISLIIKDRALFVGFKNQSELGRYYAMADTLILPSKRGETWGLVINEAIQFGLRVIVSDKVGCARDLVSTEATGRIFKAGNALSLGLAITDTVNSKQGVTSIKAELPHPALFVEAIETALKNFKGGRCGK